MGEHTHSEYYRSLNEKFEKRIKLYEDSEVKAILERYEKSNKGKGKK